MAARGPDIVHGVVAVICKDDRILSIRRPADIDLGGRWCFPGGAVEAAESQDAALIREVREEVGAEVRDLRFLGAVESIFTFDGEPGHEIVMVYEADLADESLYEREEIEGRESQGEPITARWMPVAEFEREGAPPLYPEGLIALLRSAGAGGGGKR